MIELLLKVRREKSRYASIFSKELLCNLILLTGIHLNLQTAHIHNISLI
uniref:Uncharacterized protein n=1 Tax=Arundo donax TaxID=35708 RepID=A0A0A9HTV7_ARUDO